MKGCRSDKCVAMMIDGRQSEVGWELCLCNVLLW